MLKKKSKWKLKKNLEIKGSGNRTYRIYQVSSKGVIFSDKHHIKKKQRSQINNLTLYLNVLEKEQRKPKVIIRKEINEGQSDRLKKKT